MSLSMDDLKAIYNIYESMECIKDIDIDMDMYDKENIKYVISYDRELQFCKNRLDTKSNAKKIYTCEILNCNNTAVRNSNVCKIHSRDRCNTLNCFNKRYRDNMCKKHMVNKCIIARCINKVHEAKLCKNHFYIKDVCREKRCTNTVFKYNLCQQHLDKLCKIPDCRNTVYKNDFCKRHTVDICIQKYCKRVVFNSNTYCKAHNVAYSQICTTRTCLSKKLPNLDKCLIHSK